MAVVALHRSTSGEREARIADLATDCLLRELDTYPKPGLVSPDDAGSHADMTADTFRRSAAALTPFFGELGAAGREHRGMDRLRAIGREAERAMLAATGGVNAHRGAIFGLGLLCAAAGVGDPRTCLGTIVRRRWGTAILAAAAPTDTPGAKVRRRFAAGGARVEAAAGFPTLYGVALPALRLARGLAPGDPEAARVACCFALIARLEDTNLLYRGGVDGLAFAHAAAAGFLRDGGIAHPRWRAHAEDVHRAFVARNLSPGGSADLLAMTLFVDAWESDAWESDG